MQNNAVAEVVKKCLICEQPSEIWQEGNYCSSVCKALSHDTAKIYSGNYWGITPLNQQAEVKRRKIRNYK